MCCCVICLAWSNCYTFSLQHSWTEFIYTRCQNCNRKPVSTGTVKKTVTLSEFKDEFSSTKHSCPSLELTEDLEEDQIAHDRNLALLIKQFQKSKPSDTSIILKLMARTLILDNPSPVPQILEKYPFLKKTKLVSCVFLHVYVHLHVYCATIIIYVLLLLLLDCRRIQVDTSE